MNRSGAHTATSSGASYEDWYLLEPREGTARSPALTSCERLIRATVTVRRPSILVVSRWS